MGGVERSEGRRRGGLRTKHQQKTKTRSRQNLIAGMRNFVRHMQELMKRVDEEEIFGGKVVDFIIRIEFQCRGYPHAHCLVWIKGGTKAETLDGKWESAAVAGIAGEGKTGTMKSTGAEMLSEDALRRALHVPLHDGRDLPSIIGDPIHQLVLIEVCAISKRTRRMGGRNKRGRSV